VGAAHVGGMPRWWKIQLRRRAGGIALRSGLAGMTLFDFLGLGLAFHRRAVRDGEYTSCRIGGAMRVLDLQNVVYREGEHYVAQCLNVDISSFGSSETDALQNLQEALELYLEDAPDDVVAAVDAPEVRRLTLQRA
jgi:hypothetical protein